MSFVSMAFPDQAQRLLAAAREDSTGRSVAPITPSAGSLKQLMVALAAASGLSDHANPGQATLQVLIGDVTVTAGETTWKGSAGDYLIIPDELHDLQALTDAVVVLTFVKGSRSAPHPADEASADH